MMRLEEREALEALTRNLVPAPTADEVWRPSRFNVPELHEAVVREILSGVNTARRDDYVKPLGVAIEGRAGTGKTHLLGAVRERIQRDGYFFLVSLANGRTFWESTAVSIVDDLDRPAPGWGTQRKRLLRRLTSHLAIPPEVRDAVAGDEPITPQHLNVFTLGLKIFDRKIGQECQDTARALVLSGAVQFDAQDVGYAFLNSVPLDPEQRKEWGLTASVRTPQEIVRDISRIIALTLDPTVIAIDQIDTLFASSSAPMSDQSETVDDVLARTFGPVADGLLTLREITQRTLIVVSCLPETYVWLTKCAPGPVKDRFRRAILPDHIPSARIAEKIIATRFTDAYNECRFTPPYPTWPIKQAAFEDATDHTPRKLIRLVDQHIRKCLDEDWVEELDSLAEEEDSISWKPKRAPRANDADLTALDQRFADLIERADVRAALDHTTEDQHVPALLEAGLTAWIREQAPTGNTYKIEPQPTRRPALHARLIQVLNEAKEHEASWSFRAIAATSAVAVISRIRAAVTRSGLDDRIPQRRLVLLRNGPWPSGPRTKQIADDFVAAGGVVHALSEEDLRVFAALREMLAHPDPHLEEWLASRRPASSTELFRDVLKDASTDGSTQAEPVAAASPASTVRHGSDDVIVLGALEDGTPFEIKLESLRRHTVIFAGSGSGKTVLIRRLVEECARKGVSAIVLDPNNDLARLGDAWPEPPEGWQPGDDARARDYLDNTEVVIWTPGKSSGRPLTFQPLPDFAPLRGFQDEFDQAVRSAVDVLATKAVSGTARNAAISRAVLTEAMRAFAENGGGDLRAFTQFLEELPDGVSQMSNATRIAHDLAEMLKAAMITDPLFGGSGTPADPAVLLTPAPGKRARISVISFVGLPSPEEQASFVNRLQMALFSWIKRNPAGDRPLGGLFVMDEAQTLAPSTRSTACTDSTLALASQARKYGLGLVFATQAPKGLHNQISGNATTQFFGLLNAPVQIAAAQELASAKGGKLEDIGRLSSGQFYACGEGFSFVRVKTPLCLSYHPKAPLSPEEVVERASRQPQ